MKNRSRSPRARKIQSQINITPLIDVLLVLIVIFMVITPITPTGLNAAIPRPATTQDAVQKSPPETLLLSVDQYGAITVNRRKMGSTAELASSLRDIFKSRSERTVFVQGAGNLDFDVMAQVIDTAIGSGASRIGLLTEQMH